MMDLAFKNRMHDELYIDLAGRQSELISDTNEVDNPSQWAD